MESKEVIISTSGLNSYGSRVLTAGIDCEQYKRNPILLFMHNRPFDGRNLPIGRMENVRVDGDRLIGTPVFDMNDEFAKQIADKWNNGFLRMVSAGIEIRDTSTEPGMLLAGQTRPTITKSKLIEVSVVDIGSNDEALCLYDTAGRVLHLTAGGECEALPLMKTENYDNQSNIKEKRMNKELLNLLGLPTEATDEQVMKAVSGLKEQAERADALMLANLTALVDDAVSAKKITADKKEHFMNLGKTAGIDCLRETLSLMKPAQKPTDIINQRNDGAGRNATFTKLSEVPAENIAKLKEENPAEYARLYKAEYNVEL